LGVLSSAAKMKKGALCPAEATGVGGALSHSPTLSHNHTPCLIPYQVPSTLQLAHDKLRSGTMSTDVRYAFPSTAAVKNHPLPPSR